ncbi:VRR-NUC domain-containing protein [uncultured Acidaminococcus sp.]|uniref:VRR-NUC domain-containing protein n=1 Tax=uncultured Acidaminococcus sp. TaxID=352152 RepID=UPI00259A24AC|nr:VRR-NUC domain-containing protein [uncultured Acidaminococcus sp.]
MARKQPESVILQAVRNALTLDGYDVTRHQQGLGSRKVFPDLTALKDGRTLYVEIKTATGKQSPYQVEFQRVCEAHGGVYILARSVDDIKPYLTRIQSMF